MNFINTFFEGLLHLVYPHTCPGCGSDLLSKDQVICIECITQLPFTNFHKHPENPVVKVFRGRLSLEGATSFLFFTKQSLMQNLMHQFKYKGRKEIGYYLGRQMGAAYKAAAPLMYADALVPLPLHASREKKRGYNQAEILCHAMAEEMNLPVIKSAVRRSARQKPKHTNHARSDGSTLPVNLK
jgi:predicted amidophosphoribosyltransferase